MHGDSLHERIARQLRIEPRKNAFVIIRGRKILEYFAFFVDLFGACWSKNVGNARLYPMPDRAERDLHELKWRKREENRGRRKNG